MRENLKIIAALGIAFIVIVVAQKTIFNSQYKPDFSEIPTAALQVSRLFTNISLKRLPTPIPSNTGIQTSGQMAFSPRVMPPPKTLTPYYLQQILTPSITPLPHYLITPTSVPRPPTSVPRQSSSKLGIFILGDITSGSQEILAAKPKIVKFLDPQYDDDQMNAVKNYKTKNPNGIAVLRLYQGTTNLQYSTSNDPVLSAQDFFNQVIRPSLAMFGGDLKYFDYLQTPNEFENTPEWWGEEKTTWNGKFWLKLTQLNKSAGIKTCIGSMPVGNTTATDLSYIIDDLRAMKNMGAALCYHGYTYTYSTDVSAESQTSLRYRDWYNYFQDNEPDLYSMPLILSESGVAENGQAGAGYLTNNRIADYENWLSWYDKQLQKDLYVLGATIFQIGDEGNWDSFNLEKIAPWLATHISQ